MRPRPTTARDADGEIREAGPDIPGHSAAGARMYAPDASMTSPRLNRPGPRMLKTFCAGVTTSSAHTLARAQSRASTNYSWSAPQHKRVIQHHFFAGFSTVRQSREKAARHAARRLRSSAKHRRIAEHDHIARQRSL